MSSRYLCDRVKEELDVTRRQHQKLSLALEKFPEGSLCRKRVKGATYHYHYTYSARDYRKSKRPERQRYLPDSANGLKADLAQKAFALRAVKLLERNIAAAESFLAEYKPFSPTDIWNALPCVAGLAAPFISTGNEADQDILQWLQTPPAREAPYPENLIYFAASGQKMRSKSETLIASILESHAVPFRYEADLALGSRTIFPDFTIMRRSDRRVFYWEHFGMMDDEGYRKAAADKLAHYSAYEIQPFEQLITTYESKSQPFDTTHIDRIVRTLLV